MTLTAANRDSYDGFIPPQKAAGSDSFLSLARTVRQMLTILGNAKQDRGPTTPFYKEEGEWSFESTSM